MFDLRKRYEIDLNILNEGSFGKLFKGKDKMDPTH